ncbi:hypothetical protein N326_00735, partial [Eurypyga helias]
AWLKLKLASRSQESVSDLSEEDQQRTVERSARKSALAKDPRLCGLEAASESSHNQEQDTKRFEAPSDERFQRDKQPIRPEELVESSLQRAMLLLRADPSDGCLLKDMEFRTLSTVQTPVCNQHQTVPTGCSDAAVRSAAASDTHTKLHSPPQKQLPVEKCSEDMAKQITAITFSSRKRLQSPVASTVHSSSLARGNLDGMMPIEVACASTEEQSHGKRHWESSK